MDCSPPGSSVHGILQARILEWGAISSSRGSFQPRDCTGISCVILHWQADSFTTEPPGKPHCHLYCWQKVLQRKQGRRKPLLPFLLSALVPVPIYGSQLARDPGKCIFRQPPPRHIHTQHTAECKGVGVESKEQMTVTLYNVGKKSAYESIKTSGRQRQSKKTRNFFFILNIMGD